MTRHAGLGVLSMGILLAGCGGGDGGGATGEDPPGQPLDADIRTMQLGTTTGADGSTYVDFVVEDDETDMLVTVATDNATDHVYVDEAIAPDGSLVWDGDEQFWSDYSLSYAAWPDILTSLNWPILESHGSLQTGQWSFRFTTVDNRQWQPTPNVEIGIYAQFSNDPGFDAGSVDVHVVYTGGTGSDPVVTEAVEGAFAIWTAVYEQVGVDPSFTSDVYPSQAVFSPPGEGSFAEYLALADANEVGTINLVLVPEFTGAGGAYTLGQAGGIPGPLVATSYSAVAVNVAAHMGPDLLFDAEEARILAETMAHEMGHYLGLFHPVEDGWEYFDALSDTPECSTMSGCEGALGRNLMFPYTVCDGGGCQPQDQLTAAQGAVVHRYVGVY